MADKLIAAAGVRTTVLQLSFAVLISATLVAQAFSSDNQQAKSLFEEGSAQLDPERNHKHLGRAVEYGPGHSHFYSSSDQLDQKRYPQAIKSFDRAIEIDPGYADAYSSRAEAYHRSRKYDDAISDYNTAIEIEPDNADFYYGRAHVKSHIGNKEESLVDMGKAIELNPDKPEYFYQRGRIRFELKLFQEAIDDYDTVLTLDPEPFDALVAITSKARAKAELGLYSEALEYYSLAIELEPSSIYLYNRRADTKKKLGLRFQTIEDYFMLELIDLGIGP